MIEFSCDNCGHKLGVRDDHAGKRGRCPKCQSVVLVPEKSILVNFLCENCGQKISAIHTRAGKKGKCPKCRTTLDVPAGYNLTLLDAPAEYNIQDQTADQFSEPQDVTEREQDARAGSATKEIEPASRRNLPWFIDIFLYPTSAAGLTHLAIFAGVPFLIRLVGLLLGPLALVLLFPSRIIGILIGCYMCWYFAECVRDSAAGFVRAPEAFADADIGSMVWQWLYLGICYAIFGLPAAFYVSFANRTDTTFWILVAYGVFFFPMALLAVIMFDTSSAFNPILWIASILSTFFQYCGLVLMLAGIVLAFRALISLGGTQAPGQIGIGASILEAIFTCLLVYLVFVVAHLLGRFYWRNQEKLNWEV